MRALVVGGGISGLATALVLSRNGVDVELVERRADTSALGSGITLVGPALRALDELGLLEECLARGMGSTQFRICAPTGDEVLTLPLYPAKPGLPGLMGMLRPDLHDIPLHAVLGTGATVRNNVSPVAVGENASGVDVTFADGTVSAFDLVIGADGLRSTVRGLVMGPIAPTFRAQACLRAVVPRPPEVTQETQFQGRGQRHVGLTPTGPNTMYLYCCVPVGDTSAPQSQALPEILRDYLAGFGGPIAAARESIHDPDQVNYTALETILVGEPWYRGHTVLVGDAAHCTTPQLAAGAAMCLEDALVLGDELARAATIAEGLQAYSKRRFDRCRYVVESSTQLTAWQVQDETPDEQQRQLVAEAIGVLAGAY